VIVLLKGAFGIGKTTVARALVARLPDKRRPTVLGLRLVRRVAFADKLTLP